MTTKGTAEQRSTLAGAVWHWPPTVPPNTRTNTTSQLDAHPLDHNTISDALNVLVQRGAYTTRGKPPALSLVLGTGWSNYGSEFGTPHVVRSGGLVSVHGLVVALSNSTATIATLPVGYRPPQSVFTLQGMSAAPNLCRMDYKATGIIGSPFAANTAMAYLSLTATFDASPAYGIEWGYDVMSDFYALGGSTYIDIGNGAVWGNGVRYTGNGGGVGWGSGVWTTNNTYALLGVSIDPASSQRGRPTQFGWNFATPAAAYAALNDAARANFIPAWMLYRDASGVYSVYADAREWL